MAPGVNDGKVYVSTVPTDVTRTTTAAWPGSSGRSTPRPARTLDLQHRAEALWSKKHKEVNSGGGLWYPPSFDGKGGLYFGTGNPVPLPGNEEFPWGSSRPGPNLYSDSLVKLDENTGKLQWYYQETPHDLYDWDFQDPPILATVGGRELAIGAGKSGIVVAVDAKTGKPVWKTPVGRHNGHDNDDLLRCAANTRRSRRAKSSRASSAASSPRWRPARRCSSRRWSTTR